MGRLLLPVTCFLLLIAGCTSVEIHKVPSKAQYSTWNDQKQAQVDAMKGLRFYLPRPYVHVYEPFVISANTYIVHGTVTPDGQYVLLREPKPGSPLHGIIQSLAPGGRLPAGLIRGAPMGGAQSAEEQPAAGEETAPPADEAAADPDTAAEQAKSGVKKFKSTNDNAAMAFTPLRRYADIVFLPDFDEQYVVREKGFLGNSDTEVNLGQGWSLQGMQAESDNSEFNKRLFDLFDFAAETAKKVGLSALGLPTPATGALPVTPVEGGEQAGLEEVEAAPRVTGQPISLVLTVAEYATPGLYPIMKRREMMEATASPGDWAKAANAMLAIDPYQHVSFNVFRYVVVEPIRMHAVGGPPSPPTGFNSDFLPATGSGCDNEALLAGIENDLNRRLNPDNDPDRAWVVDAIDCDANRVRLIWKKPGIQPRNSEDTVRALVNDIWRRAQLSGAVEVSFVARPGPAGNAEAEGAAPAEPAEPADP